MLTFFSFFHFPKHLQLTVELLMFWPNYLKVTEQSHFFSLIIKIAMHGFQLAQYFF